jgi:hypothetical protein
VSLILLIIDFNSFISDLEKSPFSWSKDFSASFRRFATSLNVLLLSSRLRVSFLIPSKISSAGLPFTKKLTPLPIKGVKTFSWFPASNILSIKNDVPIKPRPAEPA